MTINIDIARATHSQIETHSQIKTQSRIQIQIKESHNHLFDLIAIIQSTLTTKSYQIQSSLMRYHRRERE